MQPLKSSTRCRSPWATMCQLRRSAISSKRKTVKFVSLNMVWYAAILQYFTAYKSNIGLTLPQVLWISYTRTGLLSGRILTRSRPKYGPSLSYSISEYSFSRICDPFSGTDSQRSNLVSTGRNLGQICGSRDWPNCQGSYRHSAHSSYDALQFFHELSIRKIAKYQWIVTNKQHRQWINAF